MLQILHFNSKPLLNAYSAGCRDTRRSTISWCIYFGESLVSWKCKKQSIVSKSSTEVGNLLSSVCSEINWFRGQLNDLSVYSLPPTPLYADNLRAIRIAPNPMYIRGG